MASVVYIFYLYLFFVSSGEFDLTLSLNFQVWFISFISFWLPEMLNLTTRLCWELVKKDGYIAIWQKPLNNSCYLNREAATKPPLCDQNDDPDRVWYECNSKVIRE